MNAVSTGLRRQWWVILACVVVALIFLFANATPHHQLFVLQDMADKVLILVFGGVYRGMRALPNSFVLVVLLVITVAFLNIAWWLIRQRRWPTLIPFVLMAVINCVIFSAPGLIFSASIGERTQDCETFITPQLGLRAIRYPIDIRLDYAEQQFFLITYNGGETWSQFAQTFAYDPTLLGCQHFEFKNGQVGTLYLERSEGVGDLQTLAYETEDGGLTWNIVDENS